MISLFTSKISNNKNWLFQLSDVITSFDDLLHLLKLDQYRKFYEENRGKQHFPLRVPRAFLEKIEKGNLNDPLLKQVISTKKESIVSPNFSIDPLKEQNSVVPGLLHKYLNRVLLIVKGGCAIHCRYCFRRYFPYSKNSGNKRNWQVAINYIIAHPELDEVIFSGGDPLIAKDHEIIWLITQLEAIPHIKRLRIHSRIPSIIPERITDRLLFFLEKSRLQILLVNHVNHINEIGNTFQGAMERLRQARVTLLNQSVLLHGVNDDPHQLANLCNKLFDAGVIPYYLHMVDRVQGVQHFMVSDQSARKIMKQLLTLVSGYMIPKLVREIGGKLSKIPLDLQLE